MVDFILFDLNSCNFRFLLSSLFVVFILVIFHFHYLLCSSKTWEKFKCFKFRQIYTVRDNCRAHKPFRIIFRPTEGYYDFVIYFPNLPECGWNMTFRTKDSVNFARNLPQSKEISATLGREVAPFIMSGKYFRNHEEPKIWFAEPKSTFLDSGYLLLTIYTILSKKYCTYFQY